MTRPPTLDADDLEALWEEQRGADIPLVDVRLLASRSARDLLELVREYPALQRELVSVRPILEAATKGRDVLEQALDAERRTLIHANEARLHRYLDAAEAWAAAWSDVGREIRGLPLSEAHAVLIDRAQGVLPFRPMEAAG